MKYLLFFLCTSITSTLSASWDEYFPKSEIVYKNVNVLSGQLTLNFQDLVVMGARPLTLVRSYSSSGFDTNLDNTDVLLAILRGGWAVQGGWSFYPHTDMYIKYNAKAVQDHCLEIVLPEPSGGAIRYQIERSLGGNRFLMKPDSKTHAPLPGSRELSARTDPRNNRLEIDIRNLEGIVHLPDGGKRFYKGYSPVLKDNLLGHRFFFLTEEESPSGYRTIYEYHDNEDHLLKRVYTTDASGNRCYAAIEFEKPSSESKTFRAKGLENQSIEYQFAHLDERYYLTHAISNFSLPEFFNPTPARKKKGFRVDRIEIGGSRELGVNYYTPGSIKEERKLLKDPNKAPFYLDKVSDILGPIGQDGSHQLIAHFEYKNGRTVVRNSLNRITEYDFCDGHLHAIRFFDDGGRPYSSERFSWRDGRLSCKALIDEKTDSALFARAFSYDQIGNVTEESLWGNLTGTQEKPIELDERGSPKSGEVYRKRYTYLSQFNVPIREEEDNGLVRILQYKPNTDLLEARYTCDGPKILLRDFFIYDDANLLVGEIVDDGESLDRNNLLSVTRRIRKEYILDPTTYLPIEIRETFWDAEKGMERPLGKRRFKYSESRQVISEEVFDAEWVSRYTLETGYDAAGRVIRKTDPFGHESLYGFDSRGRLSSVTEAGSPLHKKVHYDGASRQSYTEEFDPENNRRASAIFYDTEGNVSKNIDAFGNPTTFVLDSFGRAIETQFPETLDEKGNSYIPSIRSGYNLQGDLISVSDARGRITKTSYNTYRKPTCITYPDGSQLRHEYALNGTLAKTIQPDGSEERYTYDVFQRQTAKRIYSSNGTLLSQETWVRKGDTLLSYTDSRGLTTRYHYDGAGRKVVEETQGQIVRFTYDSLGYIATIANEAIGLTQVFLRDVAGKILEQWNEQPDGTRENHFRYEYDKYQRKIAVHREKALDLVWYDYRGRVVKHVDPLEQVTQIAYNENFQNTLGQSVLQKTVTDALGLITIETSDALGHLVCTERRDSALLSREEFFYDVSGDKVRAVTTVFLKDKPVREIVSTYAYDPRRNLIESVESGKKKTTFLFDTKNRLVMKHKPDETAIRYSYDGLDRITEMRSSDGSIHFTFIYDTGPDPTEIHDLIGNTSVQRSYDIRGKLLSDQALRFEYDLIGRRTKTDLPDGSSISYTYFGSHLQSVERHSPNGSYKHTYTSFDANGHVGQEEMIYSLGSITTQRDLLERPIEQTSPQFQIQARYDEIGRLEWVQSSFWGENKYQYDGLSQLTSEKNREYLFDSIGNPAADGYEVDDLNQLLKTPTHNLEYDSNGNPHHRTEKEGSPTQYRFDALDRLIEIAQPERIVRYRYDGLSRLSSKETLIHRDSWQSETIYYMHDGQSEIGTYDKDGHIQQLKVLGLGIQDDIGATVAIEINGVPYAPLHDFCGNIIAILSTSNEVVEKYDLTAFGEEKDFQHLNPWRFSSKRSDENLVYFGKRFYDPSLQRWLSADPAGFIDGPNLYAYVWNSPTNRLDSLGLSSNGFQPSDFPFPSLSIPDVPSLPALHPDIYVGQKVGIDCIMIGSSSFSFAFSPENMTSFNAHLRSVFSHTDWTELQGKDQSPTIVTSVWINGIQVRKGELFGFAEIVHAALGHACPVLGVYNASRSLPSDLQRISVESGTPRVDTVSVVGLRQILLEAMDYFSSVCPNFRIFLGGHSEGGLIIYNAIFGMDDTHKAMAMKHLIIRTYGTVQFIPKDFGADVWNTCSERDSAASGARKMLTGSKAEGCNVAFVPCISSWSERTWYGGPDHNALGPTYQKALWDDLKVVGGEYEFIYSKNR